jgi:uncharacterized coiled-coil DUF342 family protein
MDSQPDQTFLDITDIIAEDRAEKEQFIQRQARIDELSKQIDEHRKELAELEKNLGWYIPAWRQKLDERLEQLINPPDLRP